MSQQKFLAKPLIELSFASVFWGFGFVATVWALRFLSPPAIIAYRFIIAFVVGMIILFFSKMTWKSFLQELKLSFFAGLLIGLTLLLQSTGLISTTATKSAFITSTYVIIVPILSHFFLNERLQKIHWLWVFAAMVGTLMIINLQDTSMAWGDSITFASAWAAALHIIYLDKISNRTKNPFAFNVAQSFWAGLFALLFFPFSEKWQIMQMDHLAWLGIASLSLGSTLLAFFLQVRAQQQLSPSVASLLFLLESPVSFAFAFFLLHESLNLLQIFGAVIIIGSCIGACLRPGAHKLVIEA